MTKPSRNSTRARRICFDAHRKTDSMGVHMICHVCKIRLDVVRQPNGWEEDHIRRHAEGGEDTPENLWPICIPCHRKKSAKDTSEIAKGKRVREKHYGVRRGPKKGRPMPFGRNSNKKKKFNGQVVERER